MQPGQAPPRPSPWMWVGPALGAVVFLLAALLFFQTRDPMVMVFGFVFAVVISSMLRPWRWYGYGHWHPWYGAPQQPPQQIVKVKCVSCSALNDEHARYCSQCGKPM